LTVVWDALQVRIEVCQETRQASHASTRSRRSDVARDIADFAGYGSSICDAH
jgi:hypothetical protein